MSHRLLVLSFAVVLLFFNSSGASTPDNENDTTISCDEDWIPLPNHNSCFLFKNETMTWNEAKDFCEEKGGYLPENIDEDMENYLEFYIMEIFGNPSYAWLGGTDVVQEGVWRWSHSGGNIIQTFWAENQPENSEEMNCLELEVSGYPGWYDWNCDAKDVNVICQKDETSIATTN